MSATRTWASAADFDRGTRRNLALNDGVVRLRRGVTVADEMGRTNIRDRERIAGLRQAKKTFALPALNGDRALLCPFLICSRQGAQLEVTVNGRPIRLTWPAQKDRNYWEDGWTPIHVPEGALREGDNEVVFRALDDASWSLLVESGRWPDRSFVSEDGGKTWRSEDLGAENRTDGEYMVRLWLDQFPQEGELFSEPVDLMAVGCASGIAASGRVARLRLDAEAACPPGTEVRLEWRGGPSPAYDPATWSAWAPATGDVLPHEAVRFAQWRALLVTRQPTRTPELRRVTLEVEQAIAHAASARVTGGDNPPIVRGSYRFTTLRAGERRAELLREKWKLDEVVRPAKTEFEAFLRLKQWAREQWENGWDTGEIDFCPPWDALLILELTRRNLSLGMCTHYATVMTQCCASLGLTARTQIIKKHCVNEVWSNDHGKWVAMDVGGDQDDETKFTYHLERHGVPMSALEAHEAWVRKDFDGVEMVPRPPAATKGRFELEKRLELFDHLLLSMRNDEATTLSPGEPEHGFGSYHYDGYLVWHDPDAEALPWFSRQTDRPADLHWTAQRAAVHLQASARADRLTVVLETETPNLSGFERRWDSAAWEPCGEAFDWTLAEGTNRLEVRPVNAHGRKGTVSRVEVEGGLEE